MRKKAEAIVGPHLEILCGGEFLQFVRKDSAFPWSVVDSGFDAIVNSMAIRHQLEQGIAMW